jgi:UrcA family protein
MNATSTLVTAVIVLLSAPAYAQPSYTQDGGSETITVTPPYVVTKTTTGTIRDRNTNYTLSRVVSYADLDLKTDVGVGSLEGRVKEAAVGVCHEIDTRYPAGSYAPAMKGDCAANAVAQAAPQVSSAIKAKRG